MPKGMKFLPNFSGSSQNLMHFLPEIFELFFRLNLMIR